MKNVEICVNVSSKQQEKIAILTIGKSMRRRKKSKYGFYPHSLSTTTFFPFTDSNSKGLAIISGLVYYEAKVKVFLKLLYSAHNMTIYWIYQVKVYGIGGPSHLVPLVISSSDQRVQAHVPFVLAYQTARRNGIDGNDVAPPYATVG